MENKHIMHLITKKTHSKQRMALKFGNTNNHVANHMSTTRSLAFAKLSFRISIYTSTPQVRCMHIAYTPKICRKAIHSHKESHIEAHGLPSKSPKLLCNQAQYQFRSQATYDKEACTHKSPKSPI